MAKNNMVRVRVTIRGTRPLLQHEFGPDAIPLEKGERTGVAGNDPEEWRRTCMVTPAGQLYVRDTYIFGCLRDGAKYTKKGRGSIQAMLAATLQVEEPVVLIDRRMPAGGGDPPINEKTLPVYIDREGVRNPTTKARNIRYRLACSKGWRCSFTIIWDRTIVSREQMKAVIGDAGKLVGLADGRTVGNGRFVMTAWEELEYTEEEMDGAEEEAAAGSLAGTPGDRLEKRRQGMLALPNGSED